MNKEKNLQLEVFYKALALCGLALLYSWGGMEMKWLRRFLAPSIFCIGALIYTRDWKNIVQMPIMFLSMSLGYGGDVLYEKLIRRGLFGLANGISSSTRNIFNCSWLLVAFQIFLLVGSYIVLGVWNPLPDARTEEFVLGMLCYLIPIMSLKRRTK